MGFRAQLLFFLDELIPSLFGKPLLTDQPNRSLFLPGIEGTATGPREWTAYPTRPWSRRRAVCVPVKSPGQQAVLMLHRTRVLLIRQQTMLANAFRAHLAEFGIVVVQGIRHVRELIERVFAGGYL